MEAPDMRALEDLNSKMPLLETMGSKARAEARAHNVVSYFIDPEDSRFIIEEKPDGSVTRRPRHSIAGILAAE